ncbi:hypothetical protein NM688_g3653 [Phlebia brevispora]|uniref:Uncharacterized protein n=1 Tax=Phlebia brevispora TaxID=194682 RepID=A0ACC1T5E3_9APHY|nr:hypothetical protein NM688_g3653 [Phlebia brevispora]
MSVSLAYYIVNNNFLHVADISGGGSSPGNAVIAQTKNIPETFNQQWQLAIKSFNLSSSLYTASLQALGPTSFAVPSGGNVVIGNSEVDWFIQTVTAPFGGAASFRIGQSPTGPFWTAQPNATQQIQLKANDNGEDQLWTFIEVVVPGVLV